MSDQKYISEIANLVDKKVCITGIYIMKKGFVVRAGDLRKFRDGYLLVSLNPGEPIDYIIKHENSWIVVHQCGSDSLKNHPDPYIITSVDPINIGKI